MSLLVRPSRRNDDDTEELRARIAELDAALRDRLADLACCKAELGAFEVSYRHKVGTLHEQLDKLELAIAEAELGELAKLTGSGPGPAPQPVPAAKPEAPPRYTSEAVRTLFRDVAKAIHPDLASDEATRDRRHALMIDANRAYALGDEEQLRGILQAWERSPEAVPGNDPQAVRARLVRRIAQIDDQLAAIADDLAALHASPIGKLKAMVDEAAAQGKDLVRDMLTAANRLDAMRPPP